MGHGTDSRLTVTGTVCSGTLCADSYSGGLQGWGDSNCLTLSDCLFCGSYSGTGTFDPVAIGYGDLSCEDVYYTAEPVSSDPPGLRASLTEPADSLATTAAVCGTTVWVCGATEVRGIEAGYPYSGELIPIQPEVCFNGETLTAGTDYTFTVNGQNVTGVTAKGFYELTVSGAGGYSGSVTVPFAVIADLAGSGTQADPWVIGDGADWVSFCRAIAAGHTYAGEYVELRADIPVFQKAGTVSGGWQEYPFSGVFDGGGHTLTVSITDADNQGTAPFCYINGAAIQNLNVTGSVRGEYHAAGLVGFVKSDEDEDENKLPNRISNCVVATDVYSHDYLGGIVGHALDSDLVIENCIYSGRLIGGGSAKGALLGWDDSGEKTITDCAYVFPEDQDTDNLALVHGLSGQVTQTRCYKTTDELYEGIRVYPTLPDNLVCGWVEVAGRSFALPCRISGVATVFSYSRMSPAVYCVSFPLRRTSTRLPVGSVSPIAGPWMTESI